jgi:hypothetical protein
MNQNNTERLYVSTIFSSFLLQTRGRLLQNVSPRERLPSAIFNILIIITFQVKHGNEQQGGVQYMEVQHMHFKGNIFIYICRSQLGNLDNNLAKV